MDQVMSVQSTTALPPVGQAEGLENQPNTPSSQSPRETSESLPVRRIAALLVSVGLTVGLYIFREQLAQLSAYSYLGLLAVSIIGNATVLLPVPSLAATFIAGGVFSPVLAGVVSGAGMAIGELVGYLAGYGGTAVVETKNHDLFRRMQLWMQRHGFLTIFLLSAIPNPVFDLAGLAAGMSHFPVSRFLIACFLGKTVKGLAIAAAGAHSLPWLDQLLY